MTIWNLFIIALHATGASSVLPVQNATAPGVMYVQQLDAPKGALRLEVKNMDQLEGVAQVTIYDDAYTPLRMIPLALERSSVKHTVVLQQVKDKAARYFQLSAGNQMSAITEIR
ncbi:hypothetical protein MKQ68_08315 [Chitinophaga horti]|uniref:Uncharacterized protein n=1 Tax=Chitinophaga horti TaxID=2920382 RepID=A0ABY6J653_9BACT|nr:hypothetical protein [Chitinophaga horti]UYQ95098.1 hypothetical protein MKQ68_08315 [Chitinophaga horti]